MKSENLPHFNFVFISDNVTLSAFSFIGIKNKS
jgi:hypothetical protein